MTRAGRKLHEGGFLVEDIVLTVRCAVEPLSERMRERRGALRKAAQEAVEDCLSLGEHQGLNHTLRDDVALVFTGVEAK